jgi:hypothetical protein
VNWAIGWPRAKSEEKCRRKLDAGFRRARELVDVVRTELSDETKDGNPLGSEALGQIRLGI